MRYAVNDHSGWSLSVPFDHFVLSVAAYHDTLYAGGQFSYVDGSYIPYAACQVNGVWGSCGSFNDEVRRFQVVNGELYAVGLFTEVDGVPCQSVAKRVGNGWECVGDLDCESCRVSNIIGYGGALVVTGVISLQNGPERNVMQYSDGQWSPVGVGILGGFGAGGPMAVYQGDLYLGGLIHLNAGNPGFALMRWDGSAWQQVGEGLQDETGGTVQDIKVKDLLVHEDKLFVCGGFTYAGNEYAPRVATWDGSEWCSIGGDFGENEVTAMAFYNDTLYIGCGLDAVVDGQPIGGVAKFVAPAFQNNCSGTAALAETASDQGQRLEALGGGHYRLRGGRAGTFTFLDATGRLIATHWARPEEVLEMPSSPAGVLIAQLPDGRAQRWVVVE